MTYYDILGIKSTATEEEIKMAYRRMIIAFHPDNYRGDKAFATKKTQEIIKAYKVLCDPQKRREYDAALAPQAAGGYNGRAPDGAPAQKEPQKRREDNGNKRRKDKAAYRPALGTTWGKMIAVTAVLTFLMISAFITINIILRTIR